VTKLKSGCFARYGFDAQEAPMHVAKWGSSLAVRLPKAPVEKLRLKVGDQVELSPLSRRRIGVEKIDPAAEFMARIAEFNVPAPEGYRFERDEANER
jgi:antitoxin MazE